MSDDSSDDSAKTEDPTPRKLEDSRNRGQVAISREFNTWLMLVAGTFVIGSTLSGLFSTLAVELARYLGEADKFSTGTGGISAVLGQAVWDTMKVLFVPMGILMAAAFLGPFMQVGPLFSTHSLAPDLQKISVMKGISRLFSLRSVLEFAKGLIKLGVVSVVTYFILKPYLPGAEHFIGLEMPFMLSEIMTITMRLLLAVLMVMMIFAGIDITYQRYDLYQRLRMTKQEIKDEYRQTEGDPMVRGRLKQLRLERARQRMMQNVPKADVIITNPTHFAIALQYDPDVMPAPKVVAKGADEVARRIRELAKEHNIELYENPPLARALFDTVEVDQIIPPDLYKAVAEVITYVFKKTGKMKGK